jgi:hypothetical protein
LWNNGEGISMKGWIGCIARYDHAIGYAALFWPDFVLYDDCLFVTEPSPENYQEWMTRNDGDRTRVEAMINHRHIQDIFMNSEFEPTKEIVVHVGKLLKDMWQCKLQRDFPERRIRVEFYGDDPIDLLDYVITVFQERGSCEASGGV